MAKRRDQLAQALCGCWVVNLPDIELVRLVGSIMGRKGTSKAEARRAAAAGC